MVDFEKPVVVFMKYLGTSTVLRGFGLFRATFGSSGLLWWFGLFRATSGSFLSVWDTLHNFGILCKMFIRCVRLWHVLIDFDTFWLTFACFV